MSDQRTLRQLHDDLRDVAVDLVTGTLHDLDDGDTVAAPPWLEQLADAVQHGSPRAVRRRGNSGEPISLAAHDLQQQIRTDASALANAADPHAWLPHASTTDHIRLIQRTARRWTNTHAVRTALDHLTQWRDEIVDLLDPPRRTELAAPCPACNTRMVWRHIDGEDVQIPALTVDGHRGCHCLNCDHVWPPAQLEHLALVIGCEPIDRGKAG